MQHRSKLSQRALLQSSALAGTGLAIGLALPGCINPVRSTEPMTTITDAPTVTVAQSVATTPAPLATSPAAGLESEDGAIGGVVTMTNQNTQTMAEANRMKIQIGATVLTATLADNSSVVALKQALAAGPITIAMRDYGGMEKVGPLGMTLPRNDEPISAAAGDLILYQGNAFVIYYAPNAWNFTRLGKVDDVTAAELKEILGDGNVTVTLSLPEE